MGENWRERLVDYFFLVVACIVGAFSTTAVMLPNGLTSGGLTGVVRILQAFIDIDFSVAYYAGAVLILGIAAISIGLKEAKKILVLSLMYPAILSIMEKIPFTLLEEEDVILAAIFCGIFSGVCNGIVFWRGYAFCGTESIAKIVKKKFAPQVDISKILLLLDAIIIVASAFIFGRNIALYALITQFIASKLVDFIMYGFETKVVQLNIITSKPEEIAEFAMVTLDRGVSSRTIVGEYTKEEKKQIVLLCSPRESMLVKKFLSRHDPKAFVTVVRVDTVWGYGKGFTSIHD